MPSIDVIMAATMTANALKIIYIHLLFPDAESTLLTLHHWLEIDDFVIVCFERSFPPSPTVETVYMDTMKAS